jgi:hypothetical protein
MPAKEFVDAALAGLTAKHEIFPIGHAKLVFDGTETEQGHRLGLVWDTIKNNMEVANKLD